MSVAVLGAGPWGRNIARTLAGLGALAAVVEPDPAARAEAARAHPGVPLHADAAAVLKSSLPAVAVATPAATHHAVAMEMLLAGKDVFVEKPLALTAADAEALARTARAEGRVLMAGHLLLHQPAVAWLRQQVRDGALGALHAVHQERLNFGRARAREDALWSLGVHDVAVLLHLVGAAPSRVEAWGQAALQPGVADDVHVHLGFPGGVHGHLHVSWLWPEKRRRLVLVGSEAMMAFDEAEGAVWRHDKRVAPGLRHQDDGSREVFRAAGEPLRAELAHFLDRVRDRAPPLGGGDSAVEVVRVLEAASRAMGGARAG